MYIIPCLTISMSSALSWMESWYKYFPYKPRVSSEERVIDAILASPDVFSRISQDLEISGRSFFSEKETRENITVQPLALKGWPLFPGSFGDKCHKFQRKVSVEPPTISRAGRSNTGFFKFITPQSFLETHIWCLQFHFLLGKECCRPVEAARIVNWIIRMDWVCLSLLRSLHFLHQHRFGRSKRVSQ